MRGGKTISKPSAFSSRAQTVRTSALICGAPLLDQGGHRRYPAHAGLKHLRLSEGTGASCLVLRDLLRW